MWPIWLGVKPHLGLSPRSTSSYTTRIHLPFWLLATPTPSPAQFRRCRPLWSPLMVVGASPSLGRPSSPTGFVLKAPLELVPSILCVSRVPVPYFTVFL